MILKSAMLIGALLVSPMAEETQPVEPPTQEKQEETEVDFDIKEWLAQWLTPQQVAMVMTWIAYAGTIIGLIVKLYQLAKTKSLSNENVKDLIMKELGDKVDKSVQDNLATSIVAINKTIERQNEVLALLAKVSALSQENTPESRVAILELISRLGVVDKEDIEKAKETIKEEVKTKREIEKATNESVDKVIEKFDKDDGTSI